MGTLAGRRVAGYERSTGTTSRTNERTIFDMPNWWWERQGVEKPDKPLDPAYADSTYNALDMVAQADAERFARQNYGYFAAWLDHPEVGPILIEAASEELSPELLKGRLYATEWWKSTDRANREWQVLIAEDPAEARTRVAQTAANIQDVARTLGLGLSSAQIRSIASTATASGWTDPQVIDHLVNQVNWATLEAGDLTYWRDDVKSIGAEFLVNVSDATAQDYAARIASGEMTVNGVRSAMAKQAKARFSWMADEIDQGVAPSSYFAPIRSTIAAELELTEDAVNLMDPEWLGMVEVRDDNGEMRAATMREAVLAARGDRRWKDTSRAKSLAASTTQTIAQAFGRRAL